MTNSHQIELTDAVVGFVAGNLLPLSIVESPYFHALMYKADPKYQIPSRKYLSTKLVPQKSAKLKEDLVKAFQKADMVCVTIDIWSSRQMRSYLGITAHYIVDWCLNSAMLSCSRFKGSHTGEAIFEHFQSTIASFKVSNKIAVIITDNASNMIKAFSLPGFPDESDDDDDDTDDSLEISDPLIDIYDDLHNEHIPCYAHTLQLVIKDGFKQAGNISKVLGKASAIVSHVQKSVCASDILESENRLQNCNATRWNSQLIMIRSILKIPQEKLESLDTRHRLTEYDRKILEDLVEILTPFETATNHIQGDNVITGSMVVPCTRVLKSTIDKLYEKYSSRFVFALKTSIHKRLSVYEEVDAFLTASALDPRFKLKWCKSDEYIPQKQNLILKVKSANSASLPIAVEPPPEEPPAKKHRNEFFSELIEFSDKDTCSSNSSADSEVEEYLSMPCLPLDTCPLAFWKSHLSKFPAISKIVPNFLCIPASSAPIERLFSVAGKTFRPERCRLSDKTFEALMFVKCNNKN